MSARDRIATLFRKRRRVWVSAVELLKIGGLLAWRTEVSRCRTELLMRIENRQEHTRRGIRSYYRYRGRMAS